MQENKTFQTRSRDFLKKQGFYIVLFVCLLIVGTAIALTAIPRANTQQNAGTAGEPVVESNVSDDEKLTARNTPLPTATPAPSASPTATPAPTNTPKPAVKTVKKAAAPLSGDICWGYAIDQLLYSQTLDQWTTHAGIDIAAELGTPVKAVLAGTVRTVACDDALGQIVTIEHTNKRVSLYANLDETVPVTEGQKVNAGDVIGAVGNTSVAECGQPPHIHFGFFIDNKPANPLDYVQIAQTQQS